mmetsp:Transcript_55925/g.63837  ORF Transcript_55925/g.63837 Transcript_55925/m.63837 type:complete len:769 (+) Transcript_55925:91-2397(+)
MKFFFTTLDHEVLSIIISLRRSGTHGVKIKDVTNVAIPYFQMDNGTFLYGDAAINLFVYPSNLNIQELYGRISRQTRVLAASLKEVKLQTHLDNEESEYRVFLNEWETKLAQGFISGSETPSVCDIALYSFIESEFHKDDSAAAKLYPNLLSFVSRCDKFENFPIMDELRDKYGNKLYISDAHIERLDRTIPLPIKGRRNIMVTSALPYVNNVPHLGNIIGAVLSADVYARFTRLMGHNSIYICGTDEYGTATENKALQEGLTPQQICDKYNKIHDQIYKWFQIDFDYFGRTTTQQQTDIAQDIFLRAQKNNLLLEDNLEQLFCKKCERFLADRFVEGTCPLCKSDRARGDQCDDCQKLFDAKDLIKPKCAQCGSRPEVRQSRHIFLDLPKMSERLETWLEGSAKKGQWSQNSINVSRAWIRDGLKPRCITRDLKWGTPVPAKGFENKVFYVWFDAPIGYLSITANATEKWEEWWKKPENVELYQFMGKDNIPFHTVIFPSSLLAADDNYTLLHHISTTEYLNYEDGKFSKSRGTGVFGDACDKTGIPVEVWRYYLLSTRPESSDSYFQWKDLAQKNNSELMNNIGNFCNRVLKATKSKLNSTIAAVNIDKLTAVDIDTVKSIWEIFKKYIDCLERVQLRESLAHAMEVSSVGNRYLQEAQPWSKLESDKEVGVSEMALVANILRLVAGMLEPFIPSFSAKVYEQMGIQRTKEEELFLARLADPKNDYKAITRVVKEGTKLSQIIAPIFRGIGDEEVALLRDTYKGQS